MLAFATKDGCNDLNRYETSYTIHTIVNHLLIQKE
jgi:hypothetical protein